MSDSYGASSKAQPLFETDFETMPMLWQTSAADSATIQCHDASGRPSCLAAAVFAVEDFEARCMCNDRTQLDSILASQKAAIKHCRFMVRCKRCIAKRENLVVLVLITEKIVEACVLIVVLFAWLDDTASYLQSSSSSSLEALSDDVLTRDCHSETLIGLASPVQTTYQDLHPVTARSSDVNCSWKGLLIGDYEVNDSVEWESVVRLLISLQLKSLLQLLAEIKDAAKDMLGHAHTRRLTQAERKIGELDKGL